MKKLMFGLAVAGLCGAVCADVTSANVVGYNNFELRDYGNCVGASFLAISDSDGAYLSTIKVDGYQGVESFIDAGATEGDFYFNRLNELGGTIDAEYYKWLDMIGEDGNWVGGIWLNAQDQIVGGTDEQVEFWGIEAADDVLLTQGEAVWFKTPAAEGGAKYKLVFSGAVSPEDSVFPLVDFGNCIANPMPCDTMLSTVSIDGYQNVESFIDAGATEGDFYFNRLDELGGTIDAEYYKWLDMIGEDGNWVGGIWLNAYDQIVGGTDEQVEFWGIEAADDVPLKAGEGLWFKAPQAGDGAQFYFTIGSPIKKN